MQLNVQPGITGRHRSHWVRWLTAWQRPGLRRCTPLSYAQNALSINEFNAHRWQKPYEYDPSITLGHKILRNQALYTFAPTRAPSHTPGHPALTHTRMHATARRRLSKKRRPAKQLFACDLNPAHLH